jgi:hypothetical protein
MRRRSQRRSIRARVAGGGDQRHRYQEGHHEADPDAQHPGEQALPPAEGRREVHYRGKISSAPKK